MISPPRFARQISSPVEAFRANKTPFMVPPNTKLPAVDRRPPHDSPPQPLYSHIISPVSGARARTAPDFSCGIQLAPFFSRRASSAIQDPELRWRHLLERGEVDAVTFTNAAQVHHLFTVAEPLGRADALRNNLNRTLIASIGPVASHALREFGIKVDVEASPPKLGPLIAALDSELSKG
jgi:hypothetical protein